MKEFLKTYPLYKEYLLLEDYKMGNEHYGIKSDFNKINFDYYCILEDSSRPFEIEIDEETEPITHNPERMTLGIPEEQFIDEKLNYTFLATATCKSCSQHQIHFLLNVYSNNPISPIVNNFSNIQLDKRHKYSFPNTNIYIQKVGCYPQNKEEIEREVSKHFDKATNNWLYKAKESINSSFGIGAFAYSRRIVEKELIKIIEEIKSLPDSDSHGISDLLEKYEKNNKTSTIYDNIYEYLPSSLKDLGDNPISLLYKLTSEGLHSMSESECLEKAETIIEILEFVIIKINEEKSEIKRMKDAIKRAKSD